MHRVVLLLAALLLSLPAAAGQVLVDFLDVGQGDAILIRGGGKSVLIDGGDKNIDPTPNLRELGVREVDLLIASHPHADHIGGLVPLLQDLSVRQYMDNRMVKETVVYRDLMKQVDAQRLRYIPARRGLEITLGDEAKLIVLWPGDTLLEDTRSDENSNSVVLLLHHGDVTMLFTGDAEEPTEEALVDAGIGHVDVLKVAHHGSGHSSKERFLSATTPTHAVISCGKNNRFDHPYPETLERLGLIGATVWRTDTQGHVRAVSDGEKVLMLHGTIRRVESKTPLPDAAAQPAEAAPDTPPPPPPPSPVMAPTGSPRDVY